MTHQNELEKKKYRNWVRGGLAFKYLKDGIEGFADDVVKQEHARIIRAVCGTSGRTCNQCSFRSLRPLHKCVKDPVTGRDRCPWSQTNCNCLYAKKKASCPSNICDRIMEEILQSHGSDLPAPKWENTDTTHWCSEPWEIAKCYINAPGYRKKKTVAEMDTPALLHLFVNNIKLHSHLSCNMSGANLFIKTRERRNDIFHSPSMELEELELTECIDDMIKILEDPKELKVKHNAQMAVIKLKQLKEQNFVITTHDEAEVCREALASIAKRSDELQEMIKNARTEINTDKTNARDAIQKDLQGAQDAIDTNRMNATTDIQTSLQDAKDAIDTNRTDATTAIQTSLNDAKAIIDANRTDATETIQTSLQDAKAVIQTKLQDALQEFTSNTNIQEFSQSILQVKKQISDLEIGNRQEISTIKKRLQEIENYIGLLKDMKAAGDKQREKLKYVKEKQDLQERLVSLYQRHYVKTSISPLKTRENDVIIDEVYVSPKMAIEVETQYNTEQDNEGQTHEPKRFIQGYHEIFQKNGDRNKSIYIVGDVGTGKSSFSKMIIRNWCTAVTNSTTGPVTDSVKEVSYFDFLFFVPLQRMSGLGDLIEMIKAFVNAAGLASDELIENIFQEESERCLIVADGLDEWTPSKEQRFIPHVSDGLPMRYRVKNATVITLSRPSARGILNMRSSECDQKVKLQGIESHKFLIQRYFRKVGRAHQNLTYGGFMDELKKAELEHLEHTPLLLQQLIWLYWNGKDIGKSISETYCHIVNIMLGWSNDKGGKEDRTCIQSQEDVQLPEIFRKFPRCNENKRLLLSLARIAFEEMTLETGSCTFGRSLLKEHGVSDVEIEALIQSGFLYEENNFDPTEEPTKLEFIHISYLEYFAAVYVSSHCSTEQQSKDIIKDLFKNCKSTADVLKISNVLRMICGLLPSLITLLSKAISVFTSNEQNLRKDQFWNYYVTNSAVEIQSLMIDCLSECGSDVQSMISISDVILHENTRTSFLERIIPENVLSIYSYNMLDVKCIAGMKQLQHVAIHFCTLSHSEMVMLCSIMQEVPLKYLDMNSVCCTDAGCEGHCIDLSNHVKLHTFLCLSSPNVKITSINTKNLETLCIDSNITFDIISLLNASNLTVLHLGRTINSYVTQYTYTEKVNAVVQSLQQLRYLKLHNMRIANKAFTVRPEIKHLENINLVNVRLSLETWCTFVDSLLTLQQSIEVNLLDDTFLYSPLSFQHFKEVNLFGGSPPIDKYENVCSYVRRNKMFDVIIDDRHAFRFRKKKQ